MANIRDWAKGLTPWFLRTHKFNGLRNSIIRQIDVLLTSFFQLRDEIKWKLFHNSQIVYLEHYLNDLFSITYDVATRDADITSGLIIWIESGNSFPKYLYNKIELRPKTYLYNKSESLPTTYLKNFSEILATSSFIVWIPVGVLYNENVLRQEIDFFKLGGKSYLIQTY